MPTFLLILQAVCFAMPTADNRSIAALYLHPHLADPGTEITSPTKEFLLRRLAPGLPLKIVVAANGFKPTTIDGVVAETEDVAKTIDVELVPE